MFFLGANIRGASMYGDDCPGGRMSQVVNVWGRMYEGHFSWGANVGGRISGGMNVSGAIARTPPPDFQ